MPRGASVNPFENLLKDFGRQIGEQIAAGVAAGIQSGLGQNHVAGGRGRAAAATTAVSTRSVAATDGKNCSVPGCDRKHAAKGLCQNHYAKAIRLKMNTGSLSAADLKTLAADGRATRWAKA